MAPANTLPASVQRKKGRLYAVIQTKKRKKQTGLALSGSSGRKQQIQSQQSLPRGGQTV